MKHNAFTFKTKRKMEAKGFTLIELLLVVTLVGISVGVTSDILVSVMRGYNKTQVQNEIEQQANFVSAKLGRELRNAKYVSQPLISSPVSNTLEFQNRSGTVVKYFVENGILYRDDKNNPVTSDAPIGGVAIECGFSSTEVPVGCFKIIGISPIIISYSMNFKQANTAALANFKGNIKLEDTIVLRNTY